VQLAGLVLQNLQHEGKVRLYELLLQHYGEEGLYEGSEAAPSVAALRQKTGIKEVKRVSSYSSSCSCRCCGCSSSMQDVANLLKPPSPGSQCIS
jgi:hypothetical protein